MPKYEQIKLYDRKVTKKMNNFVLFLKTLFKNISNRLSVFCWLKTIVHSDFFSYKNRFWEIEDVRQFRAFKNGTIKLIMWN